MNKPNNNRQPISNFITPIFAFYIVSFLITVGFALYLTFATEFDPSAAGSAEFLEEMTLKYTFELESLMYAILIAIQLPGFLKNERKSFDFMYRSSLKMRDILFAVMAGAGLFLLTDVVVVILDGLIGLSKILSQHAETVSAMVTDSLWKDLLLFVFLAPCAEEIMARGLVFNRLRLVAPEKKAILISSVAFAIMHYASLLQLCYSFVLSLILAYAYSKFENIAVPVMIHAAFNAMNYVTEIPFISNGLETKAGLLIYYFAAVGISAVCMRYLKEKKKPEMKKYRLVKKSEMK